MIVSNKMRKNTWFGKLKSRIKEVVAGGLIVGASYLSSCREVEEFPVLSQSAKIENYADIKYVATMENTNEATRRIYRNGKILGEKVIEGPKYIEILESKKKGDYLFELSVGKDVEKTYLEIPNYLPEADEQKLNSLPKDLDKNSEIVLNLEDIFYDGNPEDNPVKIKSVKSLDDKTNVSLDGYNLTINSGSKGGSYGVEVEFGSEKSGLEKVVLGGEIAFDKETIAFFKSVDSNEDIYIGDIIEGKTLTNIKRLTTSEKQDLHSSWSPDGSQIVFVTTRDGDASLYTMNKDGSNKKRITNGLTYSTDPSWGKNGKILFKTVEGGFASISQINPDGTGYERIVKEPEGSRIPGHPSWSPSGNKIAFETYRDGNWEIYTANSDGTNQENVTNNPAVEGQPVWHPVLENKLIFMSDRDGELDIYEMDLNSKDIKRLTELGGFDPAVSSDGKKLAFRSKRDGGYDLYSKDLEKNSVSKLTSGYVTGLPSFKPKTIH